MIYHLSSIMVLLVMFAGLVVVPWRKKEVKDTKPRNTDTGRYEKIADTIKNKRTKKIKQEVFYEECYKWQLDKSV